MKSVLFAAALLAFALTFSMPAVRADDDFNPHVTAANAAHKSKDWTALIRETDALIAAMPDDISAAQKGMIYRLRGEAEYSLNDFKSAVSDYGVATAYRPDDDIAWMFLADAALKIDDYSQAVAAYTKVLDLKPHDIGALQMRGFTYLQDHKYTEAVADCDRYLQESPGENPVLLNRAKALLALAPRSNKDAPEWGRALADIDAILAHASAANVRELRGDYYWRRGEIDKALPEWEQALQQARKSDDPKAKPLRLALLTKRAGVFWEQEDWPHVIADYTEMIAAAPDSNRYRNRGAAYFNQKQYAAAIADYKKALEMEPGHLSVTSDLIQVCVLTGDFAGAIAACDAQIARESDPELCGFFDARARLRAHQTDWTGAADDYDKAITHERWVVNAGYHGEPTARLAGLLALHAAALAAAGNASAGAGDMQEALKIAPDDPTVLAARAQVERMAKDLPDAQADIEKALAKDPKNADALHARAQLFLAQGDVAKAKADDAAARALDPQQPPVIFPAPAAKSPVKAAVKGTANAAPAKRKSKR